MTRRGSGADRPEPGPGLRAAEPTDLPAISALAHTAGAEPWPPDGVEQVMAMPGCWALVAIDAAGHPNGFILGRTAADESEILNLVVAPNNRRQGLGRALLTGAMRRAARAGAAVMLLEVAPDNRAALRLYESEGFEIVGRRPDYYKKTGVNPADALIMRAPTRTLDDE